MHLNLFLLWLFKSVNCTPNFRWSRRSYYWLTSARNTLHAHKIIMKFIIIHIEIRIGIKHKIVKSLENKCMIRKLMDKLPQKPIKSTPLAQRWALKSASFYHWRPSWTICINAADFFSCSLSVSVKICLTTRVTPFEVNTQGNDKYTSSSMSCSPCIREWEEMYKINGLSKIWNRRLESKKSFDIL